jgi:single-stranded-DNA-specific exonuclease
MSDQQQKHIVARELKAPLLEGVPDLLARIYAARDVRHADELERGLATLPDYRGLKGIDTAIGLLGKARAEQQRILIVADFDADGATSCALMMRGLKLFGFEHVDYLVPNRFEYGYGLTPEIVALAVQRQPQLLITVDNGISSHAGVEAARDAGIQVLVTDHHLPAETLPRADAIVNPNQPGDDFPSKNIAGVGVAFYLLLALRAYLREEQGEQGPNLAQLLDLVALGTVADVVPLDPVNRVLVAQGLARIRAGECVPGILALLEVAGRHPQRLVAADLGYAVGPRLNAAGRLEDMSLGIECLLTDDMQAARAMAQRLDELNQARRDIEQDMQQQALAIVDALHLDEEQGLPFGLCLYEPDWHQGVIGILAGRIKDRLHRPVSAFANTGEGELKGSARSVAGLHIRDALDAIAARHPDLVSKFGGHAMAAGLSLAEANFAAFAEAFDEEVRRHLDLNDLQGVVHTDGELDATELNLDVAELLREAGPWGQAFPEPVFEGSFALVSRRIVGEKHLKLVVRSEDAGEAIDAIAFFQTDAEWPEQVSRLKLVYRLDVNEFAGRRSPQLVVEYLEIID